MRATVNTTANQVPTWTESESAHAMPPNAAITRMEMPSCRRRAHQRANHPLYHPPTRSGPCSTSRRRTRTGRMPRTSSKGGRQKSRVVSRPVARPAAEERHGNSSVVCTGSSLPKTAGSAAMTPMPAATPRRPPANPNASVCRRKMRSRSPEPAPMALRMASMSMRCSRWACMAMATPMAPSTMATRQMRLRMEVELSRPWVSAGLPSR